MDDSAKAKAGAVNEPAVSIPLDSSILIKLHQGHTVTIGFQLTLAPLGRDGALHLRVHQSRPRVRRLKAARAPDSSGAGSHAPPAGQASPGGQDRTKASASVPTSS